ncbi:MerR family transcriptional regulator [Cohnella caldifontis]|uniref:MerR family transcriptional regulator n=1 Tax=Cohnella caldifontis TaxID=3027471 RepID=UPI0023EC912A|nr:MerR family transcriptional regulator [Cohnella sp. YIM B05605]
MKTYTIRQMSRQTGLSVHTLRYYENIGLIHAVGRDASGYRAYSEADVGWLQFLLRLRATGMPVSEMKRFAEWRSLGEATAPDRLDMLEAHRLRVEEKIRTLEGHLERIREKIGHYRELVRGSDPAPPD